MRVVSYGVTSRVCAVWWFPLLLAVIRNSIHNIMADDRPHQTQRGLSAHSIAMSGISIRHRTAVLLKKMLLATY
jgi:hypothetical protein